MADGAFTPNYESEADTVAPILVQCGIAGSLYFWLHSRAYSCGNRVGISQSSLAAKLGVSERSIRAATKRLAELGLITVKTKRGKSGGGTVYSISNMKNPSNEDDSNRKNPSGKPEESCMFNPLQTGNILPLNRKDSAYNKEEDISIKNSKNIKPSSSSAEVEEIITYLNEKAEKTKNGKGFKTTTKDYIKEINGRMREGYSIDDFRYVVDVKVAEWLGTEMERNLNPTTLFRASNFDRYLNQPMPREQKGAGNGRFERFASL